MDWDTLRIAIVTLASGGGVAFMLWITQRGTEKLRKCYAGTFYQTIMGLGSVFFGFIACLSLFFGERNPQTNPIWAGVGLLALFFVNSFVFIDGFWRSASWGRDQLVVKSLFKGTRAYAWHEVEGVSYNDWLQYYTLRFSDGAAFMFWGMMTGSGRLIEAANGKRFEGDGG